MAQRKGDGWSWRDLDRVAIGAVLGGAAVYWWQTRARSAEVEAANAETARRLAAADGRPI